MFKQTSKYNSLHDFLNSLVPENIHRQGNKINILHENKSLLIVLSKNKQHDSLKYNVKNNIFLHEDLWITKPEVIKSRIKNLLGENERLFARKTQVKPVTKVQALSFYEENHLNMPLSGAFNYGLFFNEELVSCISFSRSCPTHRNGHYFKKSHILLRFCTKNHLNVTGGLSKLIKHFIKEKHPDDIMTHIDLEWSRGAGFIKAGFKEYETTEPQPLFVDPETNIRYHERYIPENVNKDSLIEVYNNGSLKLVMELNGIKQEKQ